MAFTLGRDSVGTVVFSLPVQKNNYNFTLEANVAKTFAIPGSAVDPGYITAFFSFSNGADVWVNLIDGDTASLPTPIPLASGNELNPVARKMLREGQRMSFICATNASVNVKLLND